MSTEFTLPELGENIATGDVLRVLVKPGDLVAKDQPVLELETDKATIEVPSAVAGRVKEVRVKAGDKVSVGQLIFTLEGSAAPSRAEAPTAPAGEGENSPRPEPVEGRPSTGSGRAELVEAREKVVAISRGTRPGPEAPPAGPAAPAAPSARRMARELGLDINDVPGSGPEGRISIEDVKTHAKQVIATPREAAGGPAVEPLPDFTRWGAIDRQPMRALRRKAAAHLSAAWATIPHVTQHDQADITDLETFRQQHAKQAEASGGTLTVTAMMVKVVAAALTHFPQFNASIDLPAEEVILKKYVHIGVAVDTERGLLVPVIRDVDSKHVVQIAVELAELSGRARSGKLSLEEMQGGCFTISNLGGIGGTSFSPIVNAPELAILGISRARWQPVWKPLPPRAMARDEAAQGRGPARIEDDGQFVPRLMLPLSLSYDHRAIDGADGLRFLRWVIEALEQPFLLAL